MFVHRAWTCPGMDVSNTILSFSFDNCSLLLVLFIQIIPTDFYLFHAVARVGSLQKNVPLTSFLTQDAIIQIWSSCIIA